MRYSRPSHVETSPVGDRVVLYDSVSRKALVLNPTGALLWATLSTPSSADELAQTLKNRYANVELAQLRADVEACLQSLLAQQFLHQEA